MTNVARNDKIDAFLTGAQIGLILCVVVLWLAGLI